MRKTEISPEVRKQVYERDSWDETPCCVYCGRQHPEIHHYVERSRGGMGIPENLVCLCTRCHRQLHNGDKHIKKFCRSYLESKYENWDEESLIVTKETL
jgi:5-methylcytosine-specific restriction endonuclease McrA